MKPIIGLDFGNYNSFTCFISEFDVGTRIGGNIHDLVPASQVDGIPSVYFYSQRRGELVGAAATKSTVLPIQNRLRYLKRHLNETVTLDGKTVSYNDAIVKVIQHCIRVANSQLHDRFQMRTNLVSIAYPATYHSNDLQRLIDLVQMATLEDGTKVEVFGTIREPAAAALDYLSQFDKNGPDRTVLVYDLGGGTFDLGLVAVYPKGKKNNAGNTIYYDIIDLGGIRELGGKDFDGVMFRLLSNKANTTLSSLSEGRLRNAAEAVKISLSDPDVEEETATLDTGDDLIEIPVTRKEFEEASKDLVKRTILETKRILDKHPNQKPDLIVMTGGASRMPMVMRELQKAFPNYKDKIVSYKPSWAIAYGAARFGTSEMDTDPVLGHAEKKNSIIQQRLAFDIGVRYHKDEKDAKGYIETFLKGGTEIPCTGPEMSSIRVFSGQNSLFRVYEAINDKPNISEPERDYREIMEVEVDHGKTVRAGHPCKARMNVDRNGMLTLEAKDASSERNKYIKGTVQLTDLQ